MPLALDLVSLVKTPTEEADLHSPCHVGMSRSIALIQLERLFKKVLPDVGICGHDRPEIRQCTKIKIVSPEALWPLAPRAFNLCSLNAWLNDADDSVRDLVLQIEYVLQRAVEFVSPDVRTALSLYQLACNAHAITCLAHTPPQDVAHA